MSEEDEMEQDWAECPMCGHPGCQGECLADDNDDDYSLEDEDS